MLRLVHVLAVVCVLMALTSCTIGPRIATNYVVLHPGRPVQILENASLKSRTLDGSADAVEQDLGGWVAMPPDHWEAVKRAIEQGR